MEIARGLVCGGGGCSRLKKRCRSEMEAVQALVRKAEALVARKVARGGAVLSPAAARPKARPFHRRGRNESPAGVTKPTVIMTMAQNDAEGASAAVSRSSPCELEDGEITDGSCPAEMEIDIFGVGATLPAYNPVVLSPVAEQEEELPAITGGVSPLPVPPVEPEADECIDIVGDSSPATRPSSCNTSSTGEYSPRSSRSQPSSSSGSGSGSDSDEEDEGNSGSSRPRTADHPPVEAVALVAEQEEELIKTSGGVSPLPVHEDPLDLDASPLIKPPANECITKPSEPQVAEEDKIKEESLTERDSLPLAGSKMSELIAKARQAKLRVCQQGR
uniref:Uncharacterized protein n=1 Tax=Oryza brachyantha TaxID=4533 RepID=J3MDP9_ORYBR